MPRSQYLTHSEGEEPVIFATRLPIALALGLVASAGLTLGRWLTWRPYPPILMLYDTIIVGGLFCLYLLVLNRAFGNRGRISPELR